MEQQEEIFQVTVQINEGMEPTTLTVIAEENSGPGVEQDVVFKVTRDKDSEQLAVLIPDTDHCWKLLEGDIAQPDVDLIGAAIDAHYA